MDLNFLRQKIDGIDDELVKLFQQRMDVSAEIARYKQQHQLPVFDPEREKQKLRGISGKVTKDYKDYVSALYALIMELSRAEQERLLHPASAPEN